MFIVYTPKKIKKNWWTLVHPENNRAMIGRFTSRKAAEQYVIKTMSAIINR